MRLSKLTKMITRSAIETFKTRDAETQRLLLEKWKRHYENQEEGYTKDGLVALKLTLRILCNQN
jgi:hypothetical protein